VWVVVVCRVGVCCDSLTQDAFELGLAISEARTNNTDVDAAVQRYESDMFARSREASAQSERILGVCIREDAPKGMLDFFNSFKRPPRDN
jgi:hypothetical protein